MAKNEDEPVDLNEVNTSLQKELGVLLPATAFEEWRAALLVQVNGLIERDFNKLVNILYRLDISEQKLKYLLKENPVENAGMIITDLIIERQVQKLRSRRQFRQPDNEIDENEKW